MLSGNAILHPGPSFASSLWPYINWVIPEKKGHWRKLAPGYPELVKLMHSKYLTGISAYVPP
jgi:hypothetical protein